jgi:hypothetical protein
MSIGRKGGQLWQIEFIVNIVESIVLQYPVLLMQAVVQKVPLKNMRFLTEKNKQSIFVSTAVWSALQYPVLLMPAVAQKARASLINLILVLKKQNMFASIVESIVLPYPALLMLAVVQKVRPIVIVLQDDL